MFSACGSGNGVLEVLVIFLRFGVAHRFYGCAFWGEGDSVVQHQTF